MTVEQLLEHTDARELAEWRAFFSVREKERQEAERQERMKHSASAQADAARRAVHGHR